MVHNAPQQRLLEAQGSLVSAGDIESRNLIVLIALHQLRCTGILLCQHQ